MENPNGIKISFFFKNSLLKFDIKKELIDLFRLIRFFNFQTNLF